MRETKRDSKTRGMWMFLFIGLLLFWETTGISHLYGRDTGVKFYRKEGARQVKSNIACEKREESFWNFVRDFDIID
ncbi:MAG: hypothetical protein PVH61_44080 [Candidatus Aminicenantes bacterium]|jgi:hypothetical protein